MKSLITILTIIGFFSIAIFGVFAMGHGIGHSHNGCIAATANGQPCPPNDDVLRFLTFHLDAFKSFSTTTIDDNFANTLLLLFALILIIGFRIIANIQPVPPALAINYHRRRFLKSRSFPYQQKFTDWLALHENSPTIL